MSFLKPKQDKYGQDIYPGDVCVRMARKTDAGPVLEFVVFEKPAWGGEGSRGEYGRFVTTDGRTSIQYKSVIFAFDPIGKRRNRSKQVQSVIAGYYES